MLNNIQFIDNSARVKGSIEDSVISFLYEAGGEVASSASDNSRVKTGQLRNSWTYKVDESKQSVTIGSPLQNAIWEEFGTGEFALKNDGRKGGWSYQDSKGKWHHTYGKKPNRAFLSAYNSLKSALIRRAGDTLKARLR